MKTYIYGAGRYGKLLYQWCQINLPCNIDGFIQTHQTTDITCEGLQIYTIDSVPEIKDSKVLIALADRDVIKEIRTMLLMQIGCKVENIIDCSGLIESNMLKTGDKYCLLCQERVEEFSPGGCSDSVVFQKYHIIGGGKREGCICPNCGTMDRERWLLYVLKNNIFASKKSMSILHFAPEYSVSKWIARQLETTQYITADIERGRADIVVDITDIPFKDESLDLVIANHVLEHIEDEAKAMTELYRVLKKDGKLVLSFPICTDKETYENVNIVSKEEREIEFGQEDHVRLYGKDYKERISAYGFYVRVYSPQEFLTQAEIETYGFQADDILMICSK